jgi:hypothetical protein
VHERELGAACESCHTARTFAVSAFTHARSRAFFDGQHSALRCVQCHKGTAAMASTRSAATPAARAPVTAPAPRMPHVGLAKTSDSCVSCHQDPHFGQVSARCETCHTVEAPKFAIASFAHERTKFPLTGKHTGVECTTCHKVETQAFPAGVATIRRLTGLGATCASCHQDPHQGQLEQGCERCHSSETFKISRYTHLRAAALGEFFTGEHLYTPCTSCHRATSARAGASSPVAYKTATTCVNCHTDVHRGALGPRCETCHKP